MPPWTWPIATFMAQDCTAKPPTVARRYGELFGARARLAPIQGAGHVFEGAAWREELFRHSLEFIREEGKP